MPLGNIAMYGLHNAFLPIRPAHIIKEVVPIMPKQPSSPHKNRENIDEVRAFFDQWRTYEKMIAHNYVSHRTVYANLHRFLLEHYSYPFTLFDLGCGNGAFIAQALENTTVAAYYGVDISNIALELAGKNLKALRCKKHFVCDDFMHTMQQDIPADIVWIGLSLHHLPSEEKKVFIQRCRALLKPKGCLMLFDPMLQEGETREGFLERWWQVCQTYWTALSKREKESIYKHTKSADFPEMFGTYKTMGYTCGFARVESLFSDPTGIYEIISFFTE